MHAGAPAGALIDAELERAADAGGGWAAAGADGSGAGADACGARAAAEAAAGPGADVVGAGAVVAPAVASGAASGAGASTRSTRSCTRASHSRCCGLPGPDGATGRWPPGAVGAGAVGAGAIGAGAIGAGAIGAGEVSEASRSKDEERTGIQGVRVKVRARVRVSRSKDEIVSRVTHGVTQGGSHTPRSHGTRESEARMWRCGSGWRARVEGAGGAGRLVPGVGEAGVGCGLFENVRLRVLDRAAAFEMEWRHSSLLMPA